MRGQEKACAEQLGEVIPSHWRGDRASGFVYWAAWHPGMHWMQVTRRWVVVVG